jgi:hypothetical protein
MKCFFILPVLATLCLSVTAQQKYTPEYGKPVPLNDDGSPETKYYLKDINNLDSLSKAYLEAGDIQFLIIDAYKDGLLTEDIGTSFVFKDNVLTLNNQFIPQPYASKYLNKMHYLIKKLKGNVQAYTFSTRFAIPEAHNLGKGTFVYKPQNCCEPRHSFESYYEWRRNDSLLIRSLYVNRVITNNATYIHIRYNKDEFYVNNVKIENQNLLHDYRELVYKINSVAPSNDDEFFGLYFDKRDLKRFGAIN